MKTMLSVKKVDEEVLYDVLYINTCQTDKNKFVLTIWCGHKDFMKQILIEKNDVLAVIPYSQ